MMTSFDISVIKNMMLTKTFAQIASVLDCSESDINEVVSRFETELNVISFQSKINLKKKNKIIAKKHRRQEENFKNQVLKNKAERVRVERHREMEKGKHVEEKFNTRNVDYTKLKMVKIDRNTYIYVPREDEESHLKKYMKQYQRPLETIKPIDKTRSH